MNSLRWEIERLSASQPFLRGCLYAHVGTKTTSLSPGAFILKFWSGDTGLFVCLLVADAEVTEVWRNKTSKLSTRGNQRVALREHRPAPRPNKPRPHAECYGPSERGAADVYDSLLNNSSDVVFTVIVLHSGLFHLYFSVL